MMVLVASLVMISMAVVVISATSQSEAQPTAINQDASILALSAAMAVSVCGIAAGYALAKSGTAAVSALTERPETFFKAFLVVTLCEAVAIYGLVIAVLLWLRIPA
jgi:V/A-type H+-transporting ATPase subunit K